MYSASLWQQTHNDFMSNYRGFFSSSPLYSLQLFLQYTSHLPESPEYSRNPDKGQVFLVTASSTSQPVLLFVLSSGLLQAVPVHPHHLLSLSSFPPIADAQIKGATE